MWVKSEANRKLYNLEWCHTVEVIKKGSKYYVVALFEGSSVNATVHLGDPHVAQLINGTTEDDAHVVLGRVTRSMGTDVLNLDTAESRKAARAEQETAGAAKSGAPKSNGSSG